MFYIVGLICTNIARAVVVHRGGSDARFASERSRPPPAEPFLPSVPSPVSEPITAPHIFMLGLLNRVREPAKGRADSLFTIGGSSSNAQKNNQVQALANDQTPLTTIQKVCVTNIFGQTAFPDLHSLAKNLQQQQNNVRSQPTMMMMIIAHMASLLS